MDPQREAAIKAAAEVAAAAVYTLLRAGTCAQAVNGVQAQAGEWLAAAAAAAACDAPRTRLLVLETHALLAPSLPQRMARCRSTCRSYRCRPLACRCQTSCWAWRWPRPSSR